LKKDKMHEDECQFKITTNGIRGGKTQRRQKKKAGKKGGVTKGKGGRGEGSLSKFKDTENWAGDKNREQRKERGKLSCRQGGQGE